MQDGIIKGTGNSRYLKGPSNALALYPKYEDFIAALVAGTLPVDFNGINTAGWDQQATPLNKANLLSDTTETAIWGNTGNRTVDAALAKLDELANAAQATADAGFTVKSGSFTSTAGGTTTVSIDARPKGVIVSSGSNYGVQLLCYIGNGVTATASGFRLSNIGTTSHSCKYMAWY